MNGSIDEELEKMQSLADEKGYISKAELKRFVKSSWCWDEVQDKAGKIEFETKKAEVAFHALDRNKDTLVSKQVQYQRTLQSIVKC